MRRDERERRAVEAAPLHRDPEAERHREQQGDAARADRSGRQREQHRQSSAEQDQPPARRCRTPVAGRPATVRISRRLDDHRAEGHQAERLEDRAPARRPSGAGAAREQAGEAAGEHAATAAAVKTTTPARKISHSLRLGCAGGRGAPAQRMAAAPSQRRQPVRGGVGRRPRRAAGPAASAGDGEAERRGQRAAPARAQRAGQRQARGRGGAPSTAPSPKPSARHPSASPRTPSATRAGIHGRMPSAPRRSHRFPGWHGSALNRAATEPRRTAVTRKLSLYARR